MTTMSESESKSGDGIVEEAEQSECRPEEIQDLVMSGEYHQAILLLGHVFQCGDGSWTEWVFLQLHHHHLQWTQQQADERSCLEFIQRVSMRLAQLSLERLDRNWQCFGHICSYYQQPFDPFLFYNTWIHYSMAELACDMAKRGDVGAIQIVWHYFPTQADPHLWRPHLNPTMPASEYVHLMDLADVEALRRHIMERYHSTGLLEDWADLLESYHDWPQLKLMATEVLSAASEDDEKTQIALSASKSSMASSEEALGAVEARSMLTDPKAGKSFCLPEPTLTNGHSDQSPACPPARELKTAVPTIVLGDQKPCSRSRSLSIESEGERTPLISNETASRIEKEEPPLTAAGNDHDEDTATETDATSLDKQSPRTSSRDRWTKVNGSQHQEKRPESEGSTMGCPPSGSEGSSDPQSEAHPPLERVEHAINGVDNKRNLTGHWDPLQNAADKNVDVYGPQDPDTCLPETRDRRIVTEEEIKKVISETNDEKGLMLEEQAMTGSATLSAPQHSEIASETFSESETDMKYSNGHGHAYRLTEIIARRGDLAAENLVKRRGEDETEPEATNTTTLTEVEDHASLESSRTDELRREQQNSMPESAYLSKREKRLERSADDHATNGIKAPVKESPTNSLRMKQKAKLRDTKTNGSTLKNEFNDFSRALQAVITANRRDRKKRKEVTAYLMELARLFEMLRERYTAEASVPKESSTNGESPERLTKTASRTTNGVKKGPSPPPNETQQLDEDATRRALDQKDATIKELEERITTMEEHFDLQHTADVARIEYLEDLLYELQTDEGTKSSTPGQKRQAPFSSPATATTTTTTTPPNGIKSTPVAMSPQAIQRLAYALEVSEQHRAQALEDLQRERELHAQKLRSLQAAFSRLMPTPPPFQEDDGDESSEEADDGRTYDYFGNLQHYYALPPTSYDE